jgi:hypothetical protein
MAPVSEFFYGFDWPQLVAIALLLAIIVWAVMAGRKMR